MRKEGKVELTLTLNNVIKKVDIVINGIDPNQAAGANNFEQSVIDKYTVDGISSAILTSNGELWQTYPKTKKLQSNVKNMSADGYIGEIKTANMIQIKKYVILGWIIITYFGQEMKK